MRTQGAAVHPIRGLRLQPAYAMLLILVMGQLPSGRAQDAQEAAKPADPYEALHAALMTRYGQDGKVYAKNETSPVIFSNSEFPFDDRTFEKFDKALDAFAALSKEEIEAYGDLRRALLQRHLWKVFDYTPDRLVDARTGRVWAIPLSHPNRRAQARPKIASLIRRLALPRERIVALPNTLAATIRSGDTADRHDPEDLLKPFLPAGIDAIASGTADSRATSPWVPLGASGRSVPAEIHARKFKWRSAFLSFIRAPGDRTETLERMRKFNRANEAFPVGMQFALIEQAFLISDEGELVLSPLIVSLSLRAYVGRGVSGRKRRRPVAKQSMAEFLMQPRQLMQGNAVMKALTPQDRRFESGRLGFIDGGDSDPFEKSGRRLPRPRLASCDVCHGDPSEIKQAGLQTDYPVKEGSPDAIIKATSAHKRSHYTWKSLQQLWDAGPMKAAEPDRRPR